MNEENKKPKTFKFSDLKKKHHNLDDENSSDIIQIRIDISGRTKEMFLAFMDKYNIERYTDTFRLIVKRAYDLDIKKGSE